MSRQFRTEHQASSEQKAFIAMPTGSGFLQCPPVIALVEALEDLKQRGIGYVLFIEAGNCHVDDTRNSAVREFLRSDCTDLLFIDADVGFPPDAAAHLLSLDRDVVAGVYPKKHDDPDFPVTVPAGVELWSEADGCVEVEGAPTGFMRIRRNVLEAMAQKYAHRRYRGQGDGPDDTPYTILFERTYEDGRRFSGDYAFCRKWRAMGGKIYVDPEIPFTHEGLKEWGGTLGDHWRNVHGVTATKYTKAVERLKEGDDSPEVFIDLFKGWDNPWAATPSLLAAAYKLAAQAKGPILECGSGLTTLALALGALQSGVRVVSLEHDSAWLARITHELTKFSLAATVRYAPIVAHGDGLQWYTKPEAESSYALVICDGPPRLYGREGLFSAMREEIKDAVIVMDDTDDKKQLDLLNKWANENGAEVITVGDARKFSVARKP